MNKTAFLIIALILMLPIKIVAQTYTLTFDYDSNGNRVLRELVFEEIRDHFFRPQEISLDETFCIIHFEVLSWQSQQHRHN